MNGLSSRASVQQVYSPANSLTIRYPVEPKNRMTGMSARVDLEPLTSKCKYRTAREWWRFCDQYTTHYSKTPM